MTDEEILRNQMDRLNNNSHYGLCDVKTTIDDNTPIMMTAGEIERNMLIASNWGLNSSEIAKIIHNCIERNAGNGYDRLNCPKPPIYIGPVKVETLKERLDNYKKHKHIKEDNKMMEATSTQVIDDVKAVDFEIMRDVINDEDTLKMFASTDDDIFAFEFHGDDLLQLCRRAGLFGGWENEQKIREKNRKINELNQELHQFKRDKERLTDKLDRALIEKQQIKEEYEETIEELQHKYNLERGANEALRKFFMRYAGDGTAIECNCIVGDDEVTYVIVDKEEYKALKNCNCNIRLHGMDFTRDQLVDRILELEKLKTPSIENFADEEPSSRRDILRCAEKCVCGHREHDYGTPESNFQLIADLWNDYLFPKLKENKNVISAMDVAMMMALMKVSRIRNGGGSGDSFVDLAGYAACGGEIWHLKKKTDTE